MSNLVTQLCDVSSVVTDLDMANGFAVKFAVQENGDVASNAALHQVDNALTMLCMDNALMMLTISPSMLPSTHDDAVKG
jgi:hypothetical protein